MEERKEPGQSGLVLTSTVLYCAGALIFTFMPAYLGAIDKLLRVSPAALGALAAAELWAIAFASLTAPLWIGRLDWRVWARIGAMTSLAGQLASLWVTDFNLLLAVRIVTGAMGEGVLMALSYSLLGQTHNVERSFGIAYGVSIAIGTVCLYFNLQLDRASGSIGVLAVLAMLAVLACLMSFLVAPNLRRPAADDRLHPLRPVPAIRAAWRSVAIWVSVAQAIWYAGAGSFWSFAEQLAAHNAMPSAQIAQVMGIGTAAALIGTLLTIGMANRFGRRVPTIVSTLLTAVAIFAFARTSGFLLATSELALFNIFWACGTIYLTAAACSFDSSGKIAVLLPAFQTIGMALGTFVLGRSIRDFGFEIAPWVAGAFLMVGMLLALLCMTLRKRELGADIARMSLESSRAG